MTDVGDYLSALATANRHGFGFLLAYSTTWLVAAALWWRVSPQVGAYAALFQGMVALPLGLGLTALFAAGERPGDPTMNAPSWVPSSPSRRPSWSPSRSGGLARR